MTSLSLGQLFIFGFDGLAINQDVSVLLNKDKVAGVILFSRNISSLEQLVNLNRQIMECKESSIPPLISVDQEGGRVARLKNICTPVPDMRTIGALAVKDPDLPYRLAAMMAREMISLGFHLDFAPILDVDTNPQNPVIGDRSFSTDAKIVAKLGNLFIKGMQDSGLAACGKHFPGHGDTDKDSHFDLPLIGHNQERLETVELLPFRSAIAADVSSIMTAHILIPEIDKTYPATFSPSILQKILREKMNFNGVIISDDLEMKAVADHYEMQEMIRLGLLAGVDLFLICKDLEKVHAAIKAIHSLVDKGLVPISRVTEALTRVSYLKKRFLGAPAKASLPEAKQIVRSLPHMKLAQRWTNEP